MPSVRIEPGNLWFIWPCLHASIKAVSYTVTQSSSLSVFKIFFFVFVLYFNFFLTCEGIVKSSRLHLKENTGNSVSNAFPSHIRPFCLSEMKFEVWMFSNNTKLKMLQNIICSYFKYCYLSVMMHKCCTIILVREGRRQKHIKTYIYNFLKKYFHIFPIFEKNKIMCYEVNFF